MCPSTNFIIPLWPTYFMPHNNTCTFSPTALKFNNNYPSVITKHLHSLNITTQKKHKHYMSIYTNINKKQIFQTTITLLLPNLQTLHPSLYLTSLSNHLIPLNPSPDPLYTNVQPTVITENSTSCAVKRPCLVSQNYLSH